MRIRLCACMRFKKFACLYALNAIVCVIINFVGSLVFVVAFLICSRHRYHWYRLAWCKFPFPKRAEFDNFVCADFMQVNIVDFCVCSKFLLVPCLLPLFFIRIKEKKQIAHSKTFDLNQTLGFIVVVYFLICAWSFCFCSNKKFGQMITNAHEPD